MNWVHDNIDYKYDTEDMWQPPEVTTELKTGDCEDMALLMLRMVYDSYGIKGKLVTIRADGTDEVHAIVEYDIYYDPTNNVSYEKPEQDIVYVLSYNTAMSQAERNYKD